MSIREILSDMLNINIDYHCIKEETHCFYCGFPISKELRLKAIDSTLSAIIEEIRKEVNALPAISFKNNLKYITKNQLLALLDKMEKGK